MGVESFISANHFQYPRTRKMISENCISFSWSEENIVIMHWIEFGKFSSQFYGVFSVQEPSYNLSKNLFLLPRILKLIEDMVDDSTPLNLMSHIIT